MSKHLIAAGASMLISSGIAQAQGIHISPAGTPATMRRTSAAMSR